MTVISKIIQLNPKHNVLAIAQVTIDGSYTIKEIQLLRNPNTNAYRIIFPVPEEVGGITNKIKERELKEKILDAVVAKYESNIRKRRNTFNWSSFDELEMGIIEKRG